MIRHFIFLEWKQFIRASYFQKGLIIKILLFLALIYFGASALALGIFLYFLLEKLIPTVQPIVIVNNFLIYWVLLDLIVRFFMQQLPVMNIKPLMTIPIKRPVVIHYLLGKTALSFFNFIALFIFLPFSIVMLFKGYPALNVICWFLAVMCLTQAVNFTNFLINKNNAVFYSMLTILAGLIGLEYFGIYKASGPIGTAFNMLYDNPVFLIIPMLLVVVLYSINFKYIRKGFYLDDAVSKKVKEVRTRDLSWMDRFGAVAPFLKNDVKLIWRNVRPRQVMMVSFVFLFYGVVFYTQDVYYEKMPAFLAFASMFVTGGFLMTFGQLVPSWDSEYYKLLMSQNIPYRQYLESKWYLMVVAVSLSFVLSIPYLYFGWRIFAMIAAGALFNIGLNAFITLFGGALNRVPVELNVKAKAFSNTNGFNPTQLLIALPKFAMPMLLFYIPYKLINFDAGLIVLALSGVVGIAFRGYFLNLIEGVYQKGKYKTIAAFSEQA